MVKNPCQCRRHGFDPCVRKIPWSRNWQPTLVFLPGKSYGQRRDGWATVHGVTKSQTQPSARTHTHAGDHYLTGSGVSIIMPILQII